MDKYETRRNRLQLLLDTKCGGKKSALAARLELTDSYVARMLYPEGKPGHKRIGEDMIEKIIKAFELPTGWMDGNELHDQDDAELLAIFHAASPTDRYMIKQLMKKFQSSSSLQHPAAPPSTETEPNLGKSQPSH